MAVHKDADRILEIKGLTKMNLKLALPGSGDAWSRTPTCADPVSIFQVEPLCLLEIQAGPFQDCILKGNANHLEAAPCLEEVKINSVFVKVIFGHCQKCSHLKAWGDT